MKRKTILVFALLLLTVTAAFAQKAPKAKKILDPSVPIEESAIIYVAKGDVIFQCDDTVFGKIIPTMGNLKGAGGEKAQTVAKPILQIPAGEHTITAAMGGSKFDDNRRITYTFLPGHYYQMMILGKGNLGEVMKGFMMVGLKGGGYDWCFFDITEEVKSGQKKIGQRYTQAMADGTLDEGHVITKVNAWTGSEVGAAP